MSSNRTSEENLHRNQSVQNNLNNNNDENEPIRSSPQFNDSNYQNWTLEKHDKLSDATELKYKLYLRQKDEQIQTLKSINETLSVKLKSHVPFEEHSKK